MRKLYKVSEVLQVLFCIVAMLGLLTGDMTKTKSAIVFCFATASLLAGSVKNIVYLKMVKEK